MKVLVACEEAQRICKEFRALGHLAYSCDIEPCSGGGVGVPYSARCYSFVEW